MKNHKIPSDTFVAMMASLYLSNKVTETSGKEEAADLPPMEALVLGLMCINSNYNSRTFLNSLERTYRLFGNQECGIIAERGILNLMESGYLKPASVAAQIVIQERDMDVWGLGDVPFIVTAKGAKRICHLVGTFRGEPAKKVYADIQAESKAAAKNWIAPEM